MTQDIVTVISDHHTVLGWLRGRVVGAAPGPARRILFDEFTKALGGHLRAIDQVVLPALRLEGWRNVSSGLLVGHVEVKHRLSELLTLPCSSAARERALAELAVQLELQLQREAEQLLPLLASSFDGWQRVYLGAEVEEHLGRVIGDRASGFADSQPAAELLQEAKLVLTSFPALR